MNHPWSNPNIKWRGGVCTLPAHTHEALVKYIERGQDPFDSFFDAVLANDLKGAVHNADDDNLPIIHHIVAWIYNYAPSLCQGSVEKVNKWIQRGGLKSDINPTPQILES